MSEPACPTCGSLGNRRDPLRPPTVRICTACGQTFEVVPAAD